MEQRHQDVLIIGAGLSGISAAVHLQKSCPSKSYAILEGRERLGGTWDLFRYPGIRSDSDMYTLGYSFRPWTGAKALADGPSILNYLRETAAAYGVDQKIHCGVRVVFARWSSSSSRWTVVVRESATGIESEWTCAFLFVCAGYYDYEAGYTPPLPGKDRFRGQIIHPQHWPEGFDYTGKRIIVIGSGATAVTLVPQLAKRAAHVTMLQRSPTYILSRPEQDVVANGVRALLGDGAAHAIARWKNVGLGMAMYSFCRRYPERAKKILVKLVRKQVGPNIDVDTHFNPNYQPWDQRLCLVPDGDLFAAINSGRASVVTDQFDSFTETGLQLHSGARLDADIIVTATGLKLKFLGGISLSIDDKVVEPAKAMAYKGMMLSDVPNLALAIGYTNASWTLKSDLTSAYVCRLLRYMDINGYASCSPHNNDPSVTAEPLLDFTSGYVRRAANEFPHQGSVAPWKLYQNYVADLLKLRHARIDDGVMTFSRRPHG